MRRLSSQSSLLSLALLILLLLILWASRIASLEIFPLHNDEGLHLTRAVEVWHLHPFWEINDGKIINHWPIAAFYPQNAPAFVGRIATVFLALIGLATAYALVNNLFGWQAALLTGALWIASPYLFLYERFAFSDAEAGALIVLTLLCSILLAHSGRRRDAILTGLMLALATLFKFTAAPFALMVALIVLGIGRVSLRQRIINLGIAAGTVLICFAVPLVYVAAHGAGFSIALGWIVGTEGGHRAGFVANVLANLDRLWTQLTSFGSLWWMIALLVGLIGLLIRSRLGALLVIAGLAPLAIIIVLGSEVQPRHFVVALPLALTLAGAGMDRLISRLPSARSILAGAISLVLLLSLIPFAHVAYTDPGNLPLPPLERAQYVTDHSAGFGLRDAMFALPQTIPDRSIPVIASMFPDSCRRANFYAMNGFLLTCTDAPGLNTIMAALAVHPTIYILVEKPPIGIDVTTLAAQATQIAAYPRPGETQATASVVLWRLDRISQ